MDKVNKSQLTQIEKYGGIEGYKAEMSRRRKLAKKPYHYFAEVSKKELKALARSGGINAGINFRKNKDGQNKETEDSGQSS